MSKFELTLIFNPLGEGSLGLGLRQASFQLRSKEKDTILRIYMTRTIFLQKTSAAEAEGQLPKSFGIGRLCSASVIVWVNSLLL